MTGIIDSLESNPGFFKRLKISSLYLDASPEPVPLPTAGCFVPVHHFPPEVSASEKQTKKNNKNLMHNPKGTDFRQDHKKVQRMQEDKPYRPVRKRKL
jgi:hypothetical protein